jgi:recombination protein RecA
VADREEKIVQQFLKEVKLEAGGSTHVGEPPDEEQAPVEYISTRCPMLNYLIGRPGIPVGGITTLVGAYGSGKSTAVQHILAEVQSLGGTAVLIETEGRFAYDHARQLGVDTKSLIVAEPECLEDAFKTVQKMMQVIRARRPNDLVVIALDSIAGAVIKEELAGKSAGLGAYARTVSEWMRILTKRVKSHRIALVLTNQPRQRIELGKWGRPDLTWIGERPLGHASKVLINFEWVSQLGKDVNSPNGFRILSTILDTRISNRRGWKRTFDLYYEGGLDWHGSALDVLTEIGLVEFKGGWFSYQGKPFRRSGFPEKLEEWPELRDAVQLAPLLWTEGLVGKGEKGTA